MEEVYKALEEVGVLYKEYKHPAVYTVEEAKEHTKSIEGAHTKNLFLRNKKGNKHYLVIVPAEKRVDIAALALKLSESRLSFASAERLKEYLGLEPGSVSPFGLLNDKDNNVEVVVDEEVMESEQMGFHPNINTSTIVISKEGFKKFISHMGNKLISTSI